MASRCTAPTPATGLKAWDSSPYFPQSPSLRGKLRAINALPVKQPKSLLKDTLRPVLEEVPKIIRLKGIRELKQDFRELWPILHNITHLHQGVLLLLGKYFLNIVLY